MNNITILRWVAAAVRCDGVDCLVNLRLKSISSILFFLISICITSCDRKNSKHGEAEMEVANGQHASRSERHIAQPRGGDSIASITRQTHDNPVWVRIWRDVATDRGLPEDHISEVDDVLSEVLVYIRSKNGSEVSKAPRAELIDSYKTALHNFIETQYFERAGRQEPVLRDDLDDKAYWLPYCVAEAVTRIGASKAIKTQLPSSYIAAVRKISDTMIRPAFRRELTEEHYMTWKDEIEDKIGQFETLMLGRINLFRQDLLCPAFRDEELISKTTQKRLGSWFAKSHHIPQYEKSLEMMVSNEERFRLRLDKFPAIAADSCLSTIFLRHIWADMVRNEYWGYMSWRGRSQVISQGYGGLLQWPFSNYTFEPNVEVNKAKAWSRNEE